jgi:hypothetical protein
MRRAVVLAVALLPAGCATIFHGRTQRIEIVTDPPGATAVAGGQRVSTPGFLLLRRDQTDFEIRIEKDGYAPKTVRLTRRVSGLVWANLGWAGLGLAVGATQQPLFSRTSDSPGNAWVVGGAGAAAFGFGVDFVTGGAYRLEPATVVVKLEMPEPAR